MAKKAKKAAAKTARTIKNVKKVSSAKGREVSWILALIFSIIFGWLGVDRFIMGKVWTGILKLITFGGLGVWWIVDIILIATKYDFKNIVWKD